MTTRMTIQNRHKQSERYRQDKLFPPALTINWLINFSMYLVFYLLVTVMTFYAVQRFSVSDVAGGFTASSFVAGVIIVRLFSSYLVDTFGGRRIMFGPLVVIMAACAVYMWAASLLILIAIRIIHGLTYALASTAVMVATQTAIPASCRAEGIGYISLGTTLATVIGPAPGLALIGSVGYSVLFATALGLSIVGLVLALLLPQHNDPTAAATKDEVTKDSPVSETKRTSSFDDIMTPRVVPIDLFMLLIGLAYAGVVTFLNRYPQLGGLTRGTSLFLITYAVTMTAARFPLGCLQDRRGDNPAIAIGLVCSTTSLSVLVFATADRHVIVVGAFCGLGYGMLMLACQTTFVHLVPAHELGTGISALPLLVNAGIGLGPIVFGSVAATMGSDKMYAGLTVVVVPVAVFYWFVHGRKPVARRYRMDLQNQLVCGHFPQVDIG